MRQGRGVRTLSATEGSLQVADAFLSLTVLTLQNPVLLTELAEPIEQLHGAARGPTTGAAGSMRLVSNVLSALLHLNAIFLLLSYLTMRALQLVQRPDDLDEVLAHL